ncbi:hypothetical protein L596_007550 [Steinernema carpocapsae]|uniref:Uncharacterized protein n=1 Tax=Steinernema carpocapsae TaxID=34508 RepID=A0A4U5P9U0_STECR|nr:hypothetical protein L596_007550 [Steinernema carpocapsae]
MAPPPPPKPKASELFGHRVGSESHRFFQISQIRGSEILRKSAGGQSSVSDRNLGRVQTVLLRGGRSGWLVGRRCDHNSVLISCLPINMRMSTFL